jgi:hypothetical protein
MGRAGQLLISFIDSFTSASEIEAAGSSRHVEPMKRSSASLCLLRPETPDGSMVLRYVAEKTEMGRARLMLQSMATGTHRAGALASGRCSRGAAAIGTLGGDAAGRSLHEDSQANEEVK